MSAVRTLALASVAVLAACGWRSEGVHMGFSAATAVPGSARVDASGLHWTAADGAELTIHRGWVVVSAIEIFPCPASTLRKVWNELGYGTAWAHTISRPTRIGEPSAVPALQEAGMAMPLGTLHPPATEFCRVQVTFAPADEDAAGLPAEVEMVGKTLWLDGERSLPPASPEPFHLESAGIQEVAFDVGPWSLDEETQARSAAVTLTPSRWLDGVDFTSTTPASAALAAVAASTQVQ
ncbi:MAG TPA: hypothetical protein VIG99_15165 [Myxococcaceae bacterium]|jgi:hypothetical protein